MSLSWPTLSEGGWNLISTDEITLTLIRLKSNYKVWFTYVLTGETAPSDNITIRDKSRILFEDSNKEIISLLNSSDWYIWIENSDENSDDSNIENIIEISDGKTALNKKGKVDVFINDTTQPLFRYFLINELKTDITLTSSASKDDETVEVSVGHGFTGATGEMIMLFENNRYVQSRVKGVSTNTITLDEPLPNVYTTNAKVIRGSRLFNVDGSVTPVNFRMQLYNFTIPVDISSVIITMFSAGVPDDGKFGGIPELTNGLWFRRENDVDFNLGNYVCNQCFKNIGSNVEYTDKAPSSEYATSITIDLKKVFGQVIRLDEKLNDVIRSQVRDDLTGLSSMVISLIGSYTDEY